MMKPNRKVPNAILMWLVLICATVVSAVIVGGATRLTNSGLSITEWAPLMGALPPLNDADWHIAFEKYKRIPEYHIENPTMDLSQFKVIFYWEYAHRNIGRLLGLLFLIPFAFFAWKGSLSKSLRNRLLIGFGLGGLQGLMGWFMVKSGLSERTDVSHYRLAAHLALAFFIFSYFLRLILDLTWGRHHSRSRVFQRLTLFTTFLQILLVLQIVYGAFVAGLRAGHIFNTFPLMNGEWFPSTMTLLSPAWINLVANPTTVQWIHRWIGIVFIVALSLLWRYAQKAALSLELRRFVVMAVCIACFQVALGITTLVSHMNFYAAIFHQLGGLLLFASLQIVAYTLERPTLDFTEPVTK